MKDTAPKNQLYYGDNLEVLREHIKDESVDLIYLDPPFNSRQDYNVLFAEKDGTRSSSQIMAFEDTWEWNMDAERAYEEIVERGGRVSDAMRAFRTFLGHSDMMAYLAMMAPRLIELNRVLKVTGSIYLHCDPTASHYLKILMDGVFGPSNFVNEIVWKRSDAKGDAGQGAKHLGRVNDVLLLYAKHSGAQTSHPQFLPMEGEYIKRWYRHTDENGRRYKLDNMLGPGGAAKGNPEYEVMGVKRFWRYSREHMKQLIDEGRVVQTKPGTVPMYKRYLDESRGVPITSNWADIRPLHGWAAEKLGYQTQKPEALLERVIKLSSNGGDIVLDPFCGCGTAVSVAQRLNRRWIGIDITHLAIGLIKTRLADAFGEKVRETYEVVGEPVDRSGAEELARQDPYQFQWWALSLVAARPLEKKKGADQGIDGRLWFHDERGGKDKQIIFSVKAGHVQSAYVRDLRGVIEREKAEIGVLISMEPPTKPMLKEAAEAGLYTPPGLTDKYPRIQILSIADLLDGKKIEYPRLLDVTFKKAPKAKKAAAEQLTLSPEAQDDEGPF